MENGVDDFCLPVFVMHPTGVELSEIQREFDNKVEFDLSFIELGSTENYGLNLWEGLVKAAGIALKNDDEVIIICTERHRFAPAYRWAGMIRDIVNSRRKGAEAIFFNIGAFDQAVPIGDNAFWINHFISFDFVVIFHEMIQKIESSNLEVGETVEQKMASLSNYLVTIYPFKSIPIDKLARGGSLIERIRIGTQERFDLIRLVTLRFGIESDEKYGDVLLTKARIYSQNYSSYISSIEHYVALGKALKPDVKFISHIRTGTVTNKASRIVVLIPFYNVENYIEECIVSIFEQDYDNFIVIFLDDNSADNSFSKIPNLPNTYILRNERRLYALENIYFGLTLFDLKEEDIIVIVDGDDFLRHNQVFKKLNLIYEQKRCKMSYGQYCSTSNQRGHCHAYTRKEFDILRSLDWRASHLKSFRYSLFMQLIKIDPKVLCLRDGDKYFFKMTYDVALMTPLMEIAGYENVYFNPEIFYVYRLHENNDAVCDINLQHSIAEQIKTMKSFALSETSFV